MAGAASFPEGTTALVTDSEQRSLVKIVDLLNNGAGGGGSGSTNHIGADFDPNGIVTGAVGDTYLSALSLGGDGSVWYKTSGSGNTGWE